MSAEELEVVWLFAAEVLLGLRAREAGLEKEMVQWSGSSRLSFPWWRGFWG